MGVFRMPSLGSDMEAGTLVEWLVKPGDEVRRGDVIAVVETQKGAIEVEVFQSGRVAKLIAELGQTLPVGEPMAEIEGAGEAAETGAPRAAESAPAEPAPDDAEPTATAPPAAAAVAAPTEAAAAPAPRPEGARPPASPAARSRAAEAGLDLARIEGSGPEGAILLADVERALEAAPGAAEAAPERPAAESRRPRFDPAEMRRAVAAAMARSKREIPHYYLSHEIDLQPAVDWLEETNAGREPQDRMLMGLLLIRAAALAAADAPEMNGTFEDGEFRPAEGVHPGVAVALRGGGLVAPALHDADSRELDDLMAGLRDLVGRARAGRLRASEFSDPTLTVSSLGERGADALYGVIFPPQVAIVGFGSPRLRPAIVGGGVAPRLMVTATLSADHRVSDGRRGARFLEAVAERLQTPEAL